MEVLYLRIILFLINNLKIHPFQHQTISGVKQTCFKRPIPIEIQEALMPLGEVR